MKLSYKPLEAPVAVDPKELEAALRIARNVKMSMATPKAQGGLSGAIAQGEQRISDQMQTRPDVLGQTFEATQELAQKPLKDRILSSINPLESAGRAIGVMGGIGQRLEAAAANPLRAIQQGRPQEALSGIGEGITGETLGEYGDVFRGAGVPEPIAATAGLAAGTVSDPGALALSAGRKLAALGAVIGGKKIGRATGRAALRLLQGESPEVINFMFDDRFRAMSKSNLRPGAANMTGKKLAATIGRDFYTPANEAFEAIAAKAPDVKLSDDLVNEILGRVKELRASGIATDQELGKINKFIQTLAPEEQVDKVMSPLLGPYGRPITMTTRGPIKATLRDVMNAQRTLRKSAKDSVVDADAVRIIGDALEGHIPELAEANRLWSNYRDALANQEAIVGKLKKYKTGVELSNTRNLTSYFKDPQQKAAGAFERLNRLYRSTGTDPSRFNRVLLDAKRKAAASHFTKESPNLKALVVQGTLGLTAGSLVNPGIGTAVALGGILAGTPRPSASIAKALMNGPQTPKGKAILNILGKAGAIGGSLADEGLSRQLTGRDRDLGIQITP